jgi:hypothetical protein
MHKLLMFLLLGWILSAQAVAATIDFEEFAGGTFTPIASNGFTFTGISDSGFSSPYIYSNPSKVLAADAYQTSQFEPSALASIDFARTDSMAFALYSMDLEGFGGTVCATKASDSTSFCGGTADLGVGDWLNITSVSLYEEGVWSGAEISVGGSIDNIVVGAAVPVPAAVWLFGSALAGLGWLRRKQTA